MEQTPRQRKTGRNDIRHFVVNVPRLYVLLRTLHANDSQFSSNGHWEGCSKSFDNGHGGKCWLFVFLHLTGVWWDYLIVRYIVEGQDVVAPKSTCNEWKWSVWDDWKQLGTAKRNFGVLYQMLIPGQNHYTACAANSCNLHPNQKWAWRWGTFRGQWDFEPCILLRIPK